MFNFILNVLFSVARLWKHAYLSYSQHLRFKNIPSEISHDAIVIESMIFLLLSSFCPENSTLVKVFNEIGPIFTSLSTTPLKWDLEPITISPTRIPFPVLGHIWPPYVRELEMLVAAQEGWPLVRGKSNTIMKGLFYRIVAAKEGWPLMRGKSNTIMKGLFYRIVAAKEGWPWVREAMYRRTIYR